jgi:excinuclease ABC subunit B
VPGLASRAKAGKAGAIDVQGLPRGELADLISQMNEQMLAAARELQFEVAARLRDELAELKKELRQLDAAHA